MRQGLPLSLEFTASAGLGTEQHKDPLISALHHWSYRWAPPRLPLYLCSGYQNLNPSPWPTELPPQLIGGLCFLSQLYFRTYELWGTLYHSQPFVCAAFFSFLHLYNNPVRPRSDFILQIRKKKSEKKITWRGGKRWLWGLNLGGVVSEGRKAAAIYAEDAQTSVGWWLWLVTKPCYGGASGSAST